MTFVSLLSLFLLWFFSLSYALDLSGKVVWNNDCPGIEILGASQVMLDNGRIKGSILSDGSFVIPNVLDGTYILSVASPRISFDLLRIDVGENSTQVRPYTPGTPFNPPSAALLSYPVALVPRQKHNFFIPRESFNLVGMLSNPMMLMMIFAGGMVLAMPYLMKNMDPEMLEEFKAQHTKVQSVMAGSDIKTGLSAVLNPDEPLTNKPVPPTKGRSNKSKRQH